jgi:hypothetical protein
MSDGSGVTPPSEGPGRWSRWLPPWVRRRPLVAAGAAVILVGALVTGTVFATAPSTPPGPRYASPPGQSCGLISPGHLAKYLPGATGNPETDISGVSAALVKIDTCKYSSRSGDTDRTLLAQAFVFGSKSAVANAATSYRDNLSGIGCHCPRVAVSKRPLTGLGDKAEEVYVAPRADANFVDAPNAFDPGTTLLVQSSNAFVALFLAATATATGAFAASRPDATQLDGLVTMARDVLAALARPSSVPSAATASVTPQVHYTGRRDPCKLIGAATLARYTPGAIVFPTSDGGSTSLPQSQCGWDAGSTSVDLTLQISPGVDAAQAAFRGDTQTIGVTVTGARSLPDLGDSAVAAYTLGPGSDHVELYVLSGNAELEYSYTVKGSGPPRLDRSDPLAGVIAMARDGLAALARPAASAYQPGPRYASPSHPCQLIRASTLARYAPGATVEQVPAGGPADLTDCAWNASDGDLFLTVSTYSDPDNAEGGFESDVQYARKAPHTTFHREQPVPGLGQQATAVFVTGFENTPEVDVYAWSGNASVEMSFNDDPYAGPPLSQAGKLAADIAMARDVLAGLRRS